MFQYIMDHFDSIIAVVTGVVTVASLIANLTPNDTDNKIVAVVSKAVDFLALNFKPKPAADPAAPAADDQPKAQ